MIRYRAISQTDKMVRCILFACLLLTGIGSVCRAETRLLVVGVGKYPLVPRPGRAPSMDLPGAVPDAKAIYALVVKQWKVPVENAILLTDEDATKSAILSALRKIATASRPGDQVMFYFSGHGISAQAPRGKQIGLPEDTGALLPYNKTPWPPLTALTPEMLVSGRADLRPVFLEMDRNDVRILALFDSCYSENSSKSQRIARDGNGLNAGDSRLSLEQLEATMLDKLSAVNGAGGLAISQPGSALGRGPEPKGV